MKGKGLFCGFVFSLILFSLASNVAADTPVSGPITSDTTWTLSGSPYIVIGNVLVMEGVTLTIEPGVVVKFESDQAIQIDGQLIARGTESNMITFTSNQQTPAPGDWSYIFFSDSSTDATYDGGGNYTGGCILEYCIVEYAGGVSVNNNGAVRADNAHPFINHSLIQNNSASGIYAWNLSNNLKITNNSLSYNTTSLYGGGIYVDGKTATISNNIISNNTASAYGGGIAVSHNWDIPATASISQNTINGNTSYLGGGIYVGSGTVTISNNIIIGNTASDDFGSNGYGGGIRVQWGTATISNNIIYGNTLLGDEGAISLNTSAIILNNSIIGNTAEDSAALNFIFQVDFSYNTITGNLVTGSAPTSVIRVGDWAEADAIINYNNIFDNIATYELWNDNPHGSPNVNAENNWWGTAIDSEIEDKIYHWVDDSTKGIVDYTPWDTAIRTDAPISPPTGLTATPNTGEITLSWSPNPEADTAGYMVYWGTISGFPYANVVDVGNVTSYTITGLDPGTCYITVTSYDNDYDPTNNDPNTIVNENQTNGNESWYATEHAVQIGSIIPDISGTWLLYMTPQGEAENGPDCFYIHQESSHVYYSIWQHEYSISVNGNIAASDLELSGEGFYYGDTISFSASATTDGNTISGTYSYTGAYSESGTWRAVRGECKKAKAWVRQTHVQNDGSYALDFYVWDLIPEGITFTSGTVTGPHIGTLSLHSDGPTEYFPWEASSFLGETIPTAGNDVYTFTVNYSDLTSETVTASVRDIVVDFPAPISPADGQIVNSLIPTFSWEPPSCGCQGYYRIWVLDSQDNEVWSVYPSKDTTSVVYNFDGQGVPLTSGETYHWGLIAFDKPILGGPDNNVQVWSGFTVQINSYPGISVTPTSHNFHNVDISSTSTQTFTINNTGNADLEIGTISITGTDASEFTIQNDNCSGRTIAPSGACTVDVVFSPTSAGAKSANLTIPSNDPGIPTLNVALNGTGVIIVKGDINADGSVDLTDTILALQVMAGIEPSATVNKEADVNGDGKIGMEEAIYILQYIAGLRQDFTPLAYSIEQVDNNGITEHRFMFNKHHFMTLIDDNGTLNLRPRPGVDVNGWGSSWYVQPFLPGAVLGHTIIDSLTADSEGIHVSASGSVSYGESSTYGTWSITMDFNYNAAEKKITGIGEYSIILDETLTDTTGDLNLYKIASNYLDDVPLLSAGIGDTGDMKQADVVGDSFNFTWVPPDQPSYFPNDISDYLLIDVVGQYNNVDTEAQGYEPIEPAYKPSLKVILISQQAGLEMIFGGIYDWEKRQLFWEDNVGITPLILKQSTETEFRFNVEFESKALPGDGQ